MKSEFIYYLNSIDMTDVLIARVEEVYQFYQGICPEEIVSIFATDLFTEEGTREYGSLWFFSQNLIMEAKQFVTGDAFDMTLLRKQIVYWAVEKQDYDFKQATDKSRLHVYLIFRERVDGDLQASKNNCDYLGEIIRKHIVPNLKQP